MLGELETTRSSADSKQTSTRSNWGEFLRPALKGARANLLPGLFLWGFAFAIVLAYSRVPSFTLLLDDVGKLKQSHGYAYAVLATLTFGGLIPYCILLLTRKVPAGQRARQLLFYVGFWAWKGAEVDAFYRAQAALFGATGDAGEIVAKVLFDQFCFTPLYAAPTQTLFFAWKDAGFSRTALLATLRDEHGYGPFWRRLVTVLFSNWGVWIPAVSIIYALPSALQLPLFNLVLCFWCLLLSFVSRTDAK